MQDPEPLAPAPDLTLEEFERTGPRPRYRPARHHVGLLVAVLIAATIILLLIFDHRTTPCHVQIVNLGPGGTVERCAPHGQHGGFLFNLP